MDLPAAYLRDVVEVAARWNVPAESLLSGLPVSVEAIGNPATRVPIAVCAEIVERALRLTREPALAIYVGMQMRLTTHGFLGFAAMTSTTVGEAIDLAVRFAGTRTAALALSFMREGDTAAITIEERAPLGAFGEFAIISIFVGFWRIGETLTGKVLDGTAECAFEPPEAVARILLSTGRVRFNQPTNRLVFPASLLELPLTTADRLASELARSECERELAEVVEAGLAGRVRAAIAERGDGVRELTEVARELHMSTRTLKRRLAELGTTFSAILEDVRRQRALLLLDNRELSIGEIAARLSYTEVPNFTRAFRKWTGMTPAAYRAAGR